jgi:hypothetical protein
MHRPLGVDSQVCGLGRADQNRQLLVAVRAGAMESPGVVLLQVVRCTTTAIALARGAQSYTNIGGQASAQGFVKRVSCQSTCHRPSSESGPTTSDKVLQCTVHPLSSWVQRRGARYQQRHQAREATSQSPTTSSTRPASYLAVATQFEACKDAALTVVAPGP